MSASFADRLFASECRFILSAPKLEHLPEAAYPEVAFIGRSNVGKSTLINTLVNRKGLAKASVTPGRTQMLNFFLLDERLMLVDLPGYGYAEAPKSMVVQWTRLIKNYLKGRANLARVLVLIDSRRGVMDVDHDMMRLLDDAAVSYQLVLTKTDKLSTHAVEKVMAATREALSGHPAAYPDIAVTSSEKREGIEEVKTLLATFALAESRPYENP